MLACIKNTNSKNTPSSIDVLAIALTRVTFSSQDTHGKSSGKKVAHSSKTAGHVKSIRHISIIIVVSGC